ncbi:putative bifunctional diguanylate cyclase/phosphodiesterase [Lichenibacterium ramalinae]|uniref:EAL domain-containing protein n=1 Tax=Lichenibacterium ramalinae TaxID=2316527 RepID=A0A4V1RHX4_9HYPH|nr:EAL domain-containing protein [Lichenibacterium ramalinae]RYB01557.1 EAL domain-containing protein [Lichenibacterium ramalinae]
MSSNDGQIDRSDPQLPPAAYASNVEALFSDKTSLLIGAAAATCMTAVTAVETGRMSILAISLTLCLVGFVRLRSMVRFASLKDGLDEPGLRRWERWYVVGGTAHVGLLGCFCLAAFAEGDPFARLASVAGVMAYLVGIPGRSFASTLLVNTQIAAAAVPLLLAVLLADYQYLWIWFLVFLPFLVALKTISSRLRGIFLSAVVRAHELSRLADRFDTALNNMPHGLAMFADDGTITVTNQRLAELMGLSSQDLATRTSLNQLWAMCTSGAADRRLTPESLRADFNSSADRSTELVLPMSDGRTIAFRRQTIGAGGGVLIAEDITDRVRALEEVAYLAQHDVLTGLCNRRSFMDRVGETLAVQPPAHSALLFVDLDHFKSVNDSLGHAVGDRLIVEVARRLEAVVGETSVLARLGGDEFVVFGAFADDADGPASMASAVITRLSAPFELDGHEVVIGASVGIAPVQGRADVDTLLTDADLALYSAKVGGRGSVQFFQPAMQAEAHARRELEDDLRPALGRGEFEVHYQPIRSLREDAFVVCEALVRWRHPRRGLVPPSDFIPIAEEIGLIHELGAWVLSTACRECASWPSHIGVAVNVSAVQFRHGDVLAQVTQALRTSGLAAARLEVEVTESALVDDVQATGSLLRLLRDAGVGVSLDDFGTGYSSLSYLRALPFSKVKIDRSFLDGAEVGNRAMLLLEGIARLSDALGMTVVVEGVETPEQLKLIATLGCIEQVQGFLFSRPMTADLIQAVLSPITPAKVA